MREHLFPLDDASLAVTLSVIGQRAGNEGWRYDGFRGWEGTAVEEFVNAHLPDESELQR